MKAVISKNKRGIEIFGRNQPSPIDAFLPFRSKISIYASIIIGIAITSMGVNQLASPAQLNSSSAVPPTTAIIILFMGVFFLAAGIYILVLRQKDENKFKNTLTPTIEVNAKGIGFYKLYQLFKPIGFIPWKSIERIQPYNQNKNSATQRPKFRYMALFLCDNTLRKQINKKLKPMGDKTYQALMQYGLTPIKADFIITEDMLPIEFEQLIRYITDTPPGKKRLAAMKELDYTPPNEYIRQITKSDY